MIVDSDPQILPTRKFRTTFFKCFGRNPSSLRIVSPFIGKIPGFGSVVEFSRLLLKDQKTNFQLTTCPPARGDEYISYEQAEALIFMGVDLRIRAKPHLHSKVYQFKFPEGDEASFVGSANFTMGGFDRNDETVAFFRSSKENLLVEAELNRITDYGTVTYMQWRAINLREKKGKLK